MDEDFVESLKEFVPYILSEENLTAKKIHGVALKGKDLLHYFKVRARVQSLRGLRTIGTFESDLSYCQYPKPSCCKVQ